MIKKISDVLDGTSAMTRRSIRPVVLTVIGFVLVSGASLAAGKKKAADNSRPDVGAVDKVLTSSQGCRGRVPRRQ